jgi:NAD(P)-dependent dehydrogenase (short-subunit alcohol dehydrogenase family)
MNMAVQNPVVIVTGGSAGIGKASCVRFAKEGSRVVVVDFADTEGKGTVDLLKSMGAEAIFCHADVSKDEECKAFAETAIRAFGRIDVLVANAAIRMDVSILDATERDWDRILGVNLKGVAFCCKAVLPKMIEQKAGNIVLISSAGSFLGTTGKPLYDTAKWGVVSLTRSLAATYGSEGIRVNAICPALTITDYHLKAAKAKGISPDALRELNKDYCVLGRPGEPEEIAAAVYFMASKDSSFITGQYLMVDGGRSVGVRTPWVT